MRLTVDFRYCALFFVAALLLTLPVLAQVPQVPATLYFADMTLHLTEQAQRDIQADVDALYRSPKYFQLKMERVDMYLPIIEPIFAEHGIPDDIKFLVIQESALISDAVSSSNAVGFWQFKESSATELGMRVDRQVDDRMNIVASTVGAAKYLLRSNATFNNWLYSLQSYQMGLGGASRSLDERYYGADEMKIDGNTYWYVKKFLSHLVAFRDAVGKQPRNLMLYQYKNTANKTLENIALEFDTDLQQLTDYNKWLKTAVIPDDREYVVMVPVHLDEAPNLLVEMEAGKQQQKRQSLEDKQFGEKQKEPIVLDAARDQLVIAKVNGIRAIVARPGDNARDLAKAGDISVANFLKYNDIRPGDALKPGQVYYFKRKKNKATVYRHVLAEGESLWDVSQKYGLRLAKLLQKNRLKANEAVKPGRVLWLRYIRPANEPVAHESVPKRKAEAAVTPSVQTASLAQQPEVKATKAEPAQRKPATERAQALERPAQHTTGQTPEVEQAGAATRPVVDKAVTPAPPVQEPSAETTTPVVYAQASRYGQQVPVQVDTPRPKPAPLKVQDQDPVVQEQSPVKQEQNSVNQRQKPVNKPVKEIVMESEEGFYLYPDSSSTQRNVYPEKEENAAEPAMQVLERKRNDPDSFGVKGPVKFIGEDGGLEQQPPVRTVPSQPQTEASASQQTQAIVASPSPAEGVVQDSIHVVQAGETLYSISRKWGLSVQQLRERNNMRTDSPLSIGQQLRLKASFAASAVANTNANAAVETEDQKGIEVAEAASTSSGEDKRYVYHTVAEGETMYRVARKYNVTIKDIMEWNKKSDFNIHPGEVLIVSRK